MLWGAWGLSAGGRDGSVNGHCFLAWGLRVQMASGGRMQWLSIRLNLCVSLQIWEVGPLLSHVQRAALSVTYFRN